MCFYVDMYIYICSCMRMCILHNASLFARVVRSREIRHVRDLSLSLSLSLFCHLRDCFYVDMYKIYVHVCECVFYVTRRFSRDDLDVMWGISISVPVQIAPISEYPLSNITNRKQCLCEYRRGWYKCEYYTRIVQEVHEQDLVVEDIHVELWISYVRGTSKHDSRGCV